MMRRRGVSMMLVALVACAKGGDGVPESTRDPAVTALQVELMQRASRDQAIRDSVFAKAGELDAGLMARMQQVDADNTGWLKDQIRAHGWPSTAKVGKAAGDAAFLIVQHATQDPAFQRMILDTIMIVFDRKEVDGGSYALLYDRVQVQGGRKQRYGTQSKLAGKQVVFEPLEDPVRVDSLRRTVGLAPLAEFRKSLDSVYFGKAKKQPRD